MILDSPPPPPPTLAAQMPILVIFAAAMCGLSGQAQVRAIALLYIYTMDHGIRIDERIYGTDM